MLESFFFHFRSSETTNSKLRYSCSFCDKTFANDKGLQYHEDRHQCNYKVVCFKCSKGFYNKRDFLKHFKIVHQGVRYNCTQCKKSFRSEKYFHYHMKLHETKTRETIPCPKCDKHSWRKKVSIFMRNAFTRSFDLFAMSAGMSLLPGPASRTIWSCTPGRNRLRVKSVESVLVPHFC